MNFSRRKFCWFYGLTAVFWVLGLLGLGLNSMGATLVGCVAALLITVYSFMSILRCPRCGAGFPRDIFPWTDGFYCPKCGEHITIK